MLLRDVIGLGLVGLALAACGPAPATMPPALRVQMQIPLGNATVNTVPGYASFGTNDGSFYTQDSGDLSTAQWGQLGDGAFVTPQGTTYSEHNEGLGGTGEPGNPSANTPVGSVSKVLNTSVWEFMGTDPLNMTATGGPGVGSAAGSAAGSLGAIFVAPGLPFWTP